MSLAERATLKSVREDTSAARSQLAGSLKETGLKAPLYLFGANKDSEAWMSALCVQGVIDDFAELPATFHGVDVIRLSDVPEDSVIINCVTNSKPLTAMRRLSERTSAQIYFAADLAAAFPDALPMFEFMRSSRESFSKRADDWEKLYAALDDDTSRATLEDIVAYRFTGDPRVLSNYRYRPHEQYFESFLALQSEVFVDGGAFDGETTELFAENFPQYQHVHLFEPDPVNFERSRTRLADLRDISFHPVGLSDARGDLRFKVGGGSASVVDEAGDHTISVNTIDAKAGNATFIKLDLEGWELAALKGARSTIINNKPKIAVGAYHSPDDFLKIFDWVCTVRPDYRVALRHYTESWTETVLYFY